MRCLIPIARDNVHQTATQAAADGALETAQGNINAQILDAIAAVIDAEYAGPFAVCSAWRLDV